MRSESFPRGAGDGAAGAGRRGPRGGSSLPVGTGLRGCLRGPGPAQVTQCRGIPCAVEGAPCSSRARRAVLCVCWSVAPPRRCFAGGGPGVGRAGWGGGGGGTGVVGSSPEGAGWGPGPGKRVALR